MTSKSKVHSQMMPKSLFYYYIIIFNFYNYYFCIFKYRLQFLLSFGVGYANFFGICNRWCHGIAFLVKLLAEKSGLEETWCHNLTRENYDIWEALF